MKVLVLTRYSRLGASSRVRTMQYFDHLASSGIAVDCSALLEDEYLQAQYSGRSYSPWRLAARYVRRLASLLRASRYDAIWIEKELFPYLPAFAESILRKCGIPLVVDYDDAVFHNYEMSKSAIVRGVLSKKIDAVMEHATVVVAGNQYLADRAQAAGAKRIEIIPTVVDVQRYGEQPTGGKSEPDREFKVGWIGTPSTFHYLKQIVEPIKSCSQRFPTRLIVVGADRNVLLGVPMRKIVWTEASEIESIHKFDVGIMPLRDSPWERGKCGYKLIQCMACGIPVIASSVGMNAEIIANGKDGFLANDEREWTTAFNRLAGDRELRDEIGKAARRKIEERFSLQAMAPRLVSIFRSLV